MGLALSCSPCTVVRYCGIPSDSAPHQEENSLDLYAWLGSSLPPRKDFLGVMLPWSGVARGWNAGALNDTLSPHPTENSAAYSQDQGPHGYAPPAAEVDGWPQRATLLSLTCCFVH